MPTTIGENTRRNVIAATQSMVSARGVASELSSDEYRGIIRRALADRVPPGALDAASAAAVVESIFDEIAPSRLGPIEPLLAADDITEIMVNGPDDVFAEVGGVIKRTRVRFRDDDAIRAVIDRMCAADGKLCDDSHPFADLTLHRPGEACDQSRVNVSVPPVSVDHPIIDIRKFRHDVSSTADLIAYGTIDERLERFLDALVRARMNIVIVGGTGSGKTTLLNALSRHIPERERVITIEDTTELDIGHEHVVRMQTRPPNIEGKGEITMRQLVINALRQRPDRIVVGECRGAEALDMLQAMSTGHDGSLTTVHANSTTDALDRLNIMVHYNPTPLSEEIVRSIIANAVNFLIGVERFPDGTRKVVDVREVQGATGDVITTEPIWRFRNDGPDPTGRIRGAYVPTGRIPSDQTMVRMRNAGTGVDVSWFAPGGPR